MPVIKFWQAAACGLLLLVSMIVSSADDSALHTGWMEFVKGARDSDVGAQLVEIEEGATAGTQKITVAIPKVSIADPADIEEVIVIGQAPEKSEPLDIDITYEWVADYDNDNYGLVIRLSRDTNWPIRLYFNSSPGFMN